MDVAKKLYGLLVGINEYPNPKHRLDGCVNDIEEFQKVLEKRCDKKQISELSLKTLKNEEATRQQVIDTFREQLTQAKKGDIALFYYSGHGAQEHAPKEFWKFEPDKLNETLVCYDSRTEGGWDLADKELAKLISEVATHKAQVVMILDCCHSGSGTRVIEMEGTKVRKIETDTRVRPLESYLFTPAELGQLSRSSKGISTEETSGWNNLPEGQHLLFAACQDNELAKEYNAEGKSWGSFSYFLRKTLEESTRPLSYQELYRRTLARITSSISEQRPQLEASTLVDVNEEFLGSAVAPKTSFLCYFDTDWTLDAGAVHGISAPVGGDTTLLSLFDKDATPETLRDLSKALAKAKVSEVHPDKSKLELEGDLDKAKQYQAVIVSLPLPPILVGLGGEAEGIALARDALGKAGPGGSASLYLKESEKPEYRLIAKKESYVIAGSAEDRALVKEIEGVLAESAGKAVQQLEHIARWVRLRDLQNPSRLDISNIKTIIHYEAKDYVDVGTTFRYRQNNKKWEEPTFKLELKNESDTTIFCSVLVLAESFSISAGIFPGGQVRLEAGQSAWGQVRGSTSIPASVPDTYFKDGITERKDIFKLIISTEAFDARLLEQVALEAPTRGAMRDAPVITNTLERLMARLQTREIGDEGGGSYREWATKSVTTITVRPKESKKVASDKAVELQQGIVLEPHPVLNANARLSTLNQLSRDLTDKTYGNRLVPDILRQDPEFSQPLQFTTARGQDPGLSVLELEVENYEAVTPQQPLRLTLEMPLEKGEFILPIAFDGEHYLPLGYSKVAEGGTRGGKSTSTDGTRAAGFTTSTRNLNAKTQIILERLPNPSLETVEGTPNARSLFGAVKILFQKLKSDLLGTKFDYPILAAVTVPDDAQVSFDKCYETDTQKVKAKVKDAKRILLYVHGIVGDTLGLVVSAQLGKVKQADAETPLKNHYDLILAFDYESIKTKIEDNAGLLKKRLEEVGLGEGHGKTLHVVAHSMGGLVSRWFTEREGGNKIVERLVMLGTPNAGSPWPSVEDWATTMLTVGLNGLSSAHWTTATLAKLGGILGAALEHVDVALDQMKAKSDFLEELSKSEDPGIPYSIIAGNTSLLEAENLLQKLKLKGFEALTQFLFHESNDMAVGVTSVNSVEMKRSPKPITGEAVASDHTSYFKIEESLKKLITALAE
jgi:pimeloyl-ACP methyl ester carboxylesterase